MEKYIKRPGKYEDYSLLEFAQEISVRGGTYAERRQEYICNIFPKYKLTGLYLFNVFLLGNHPLKKDNPILYINIIV